MRDGQRSPPLLTLVSLLAAPWQFSSRVIYPAAAHALVFSRPSCAALPLLLPVSRLRARDVFRRPCSSPPPHYSPWVSSRMGWPRLKRDSGRCRAAVKGRCHCMSSDFLCAAAHSSLLRSSLESCTLPLIGATCARRGSAVSSRSLTRPVSQGMAAEREKERHRWGQPVRAPFPPSALSP